MCSGQVRGEMVLGACANSPNTTFPADKQTMGYTKTCNLSQCKIAMTSSLNKFMRSLQSVFKFFEGWDKPKSLPPLITALLPIFSLSAASQQAGGRGKAALKGFARDQSLSLPVVLGGDCAWPLTWSCPLVWGCPSWDWGPGRYLLELGTSGQAGDTSKLLRIVVYFSSNLLFGSGECSKSSLGCFLLNR